MTKRGRRLLEGLTEIKDFLDGKRQVRGTIYVEDKAYEAVFEKTKTGFSSYVPDLQGCIASGDDLTSTQELLIRAIEIHLAGMCEDEKKFI